MLDLDLVTILAEIINFLVLAAILYFLFFKPLVKRIEDRSQENEQILAQAEEEKTKSRRKIGRGRGKAGQYRF